MEKRTFVLRQRATMECVETAVGPHRELPPGPGITHPPTVSRRKWAAPRAVLDRPSRSRAIRPPVGGHGQQRVIAGQRASGHNSRWWIHVDGEERPKQLAASRSS